MSEEELRRLAEVCLNSCNHCANGDDRLECIIRTLRIAVASERSRADRAELECAMLANDREFESALRSSGVAATLAAVRQISPGMKLTVEEPNLLVHEQTILERRQYHEALHKVIAETETLDSVTTPIWEKLGIIRQVARKGLEETT